MIIGNASTIPGIEVMRYIVMRGARQLEMNQEEISVLFRCDSAVVCEQLLVAQSTAIVGLLGQTTGACH